MQKTRFMLPVVSAAASLTLALIPGVPQASADEPATVTVRVEGEAGTLLAPTAVTTTGAPVVKDGKPEDSCSGYDAIGALEIATGGNWAGTWFSGFGYSWETILGESHTFAGNSYWAFWQNDAYSEKGICEATLHSGDTLLFAPASAAEGAPTPEPLGLQAPSEAAVGEAVPVTALAYANATGAPAPASGAAIAYEGKTAETDGAGHATLVFAHAGSQPLGVSKPGTVRDESSICVRAAGEASCGSGGAAGAGGVKGYTGAGAPYKGPFALVADVTSLAGGHTYRRGHAPRLIAGRISSHSAVTSVSLALRRTYRGRCFAYDGGRGRFARARCGSAAFFAIAKEASFSYLLPGSLRPGRYVLDVQAADTAGNSLTLARGTSRLVFHVG